MAKVVAGVLDRIPSRVLNTALRALPEARRADLDLRRARLQFEDEPEPRDLCVGDSLLIRAGRRHRVVATDPDPGTLWLALFWSASA